MKFETESGSSISTPTAEEIHEGIQSVDGKKNGFAILALDELFIQAARDAPNEFTMEYQNGTSDEHYSTSEPVTEAEVIKTFQAFARGETSWFDQFQWDKMNLNERNGCLPIITMSTLALGALAILKNLQG